MEDSQMTISKGLKNAIAFMNGVVDPNIKYWWLKEDFIWAQKFPL
nr:hypothetical protein [Cylindrospermopsis raciborskii]